MSVPATRPAEISVKAWDQFSELPAASREAVWSAYSQGAEQNQAAFDRAVSRFVDSTPQDRFAGMIAAGSGLNVSAARFGKVIPFRPSDSIHPAADRALDAMATLDMSNGDARAGLVSGIGVAVNPTV